MKGYEVIVVQKIRCGSMQDMYVLCVQTKMCGKRKYPV